MSPKVEAYLEHFSEKISKKLCDYAENEAFRWSRYIFTEREGKLQFGYCTHCHERFQTGGPVKMYNPLTDHMEKVENYPSLRHGQTTKCPRCGSTCIVRASGKGRSTLLDRAYFVFYEKSVKDPNVIVARGIDAYRDYRGDYHDVKTMHEVIMYYVFEPGKGGKMIKPVCYWDCGWISELKLSRTVYSRFPHINDNNTWIGYSRDSIKQAVKDTPFRWSGWEQYDHNDMTEFFDLFSRYPSVEYITKLGFKSLIEDRLNRKPTFNTVNWRGKSLLEVLRLTKQELQEIKRENIELSFWFLNLLKHNRKNGWELSLKELSHMETAVSDFYTLEILEKVQVYAPVKSILNYIEKQLKRFGEKHINSRRYIFTTWFDYIEDCKKLQFDLSDDSVLFPKDVHASHQNTIKQLKIKADKLLNMAIKKRSKLLSKKYKFEWNGLLIRPAESSDELISEGKALNHCVGRYAERYAKGELSIFFIRKADEPDKPYYTLELHDSKIRQTRGKDNRTATSEIEKFLAVWEEEKIIKKPNKKKAENRLKITVPA